MGDTFLLLEELIIAKRGEINREIYKDDRRRTNLIIELVNLFNRVNDEYFIPTNVNLRHTERFSGMFFEVLSNNKGTVLAGGGDTYKGDSSEGIPIDRHNLDGRDTITGIKIARDNFNKHLFNVLQRSQYGDTEDIPTLQKHLVIRKAEFLAETYESGDSFRDKLIDDLDNLYNRIIPIVRSTNDPSRIEEYIVFIKRDYETVIVYRNEIIRRDREDGRSIRFTNSHEETFKNDLINNLNNLYNTVIPIILRNDRTFITIEKYIVFVNDDYHKENIVTNILNNFKSKLDDLYEAILPLARGTEDFDIMERIIGRMERTYLRTRSRDSEAGIPTYLLNLDQAINDVVIDSDSVELLTSYIEIKTREIEQYFPGNQIFIDRLGRVTYKRREVIADSRSIDDLIKEYNFSFAKRIKVEKDVNKVFFDTWSYEPRDITGDTSFRTESATRIRFENKIIGDTTTEFLTDYKAILNKLNLAKDDEYEKVQDLVVKSRLLKAIGDSAIEIIGDTTIKESTTNRYFYFVNEKNKLEDFFKRLTTEAAAQEEITRQKEKEYLNSFDVLEERKRRSLRVTVSRLHSVVEKVFNDFSTGRINKEIFERRLAELERVRR